MQADLKYGELTICDTSNCGGYDLTHVQTPIVDFIYYEIPGTAYGARRPISTQQSDSSKLIYEFSGQVHKDSLALLMSYISSVNTYTLNLNHQQETLSYGLYNESTIYTEDNCAMIIDFGKVTKYADSSASVEFTAKFSKWGV